MNISACGMEWLSAPLILFSHTDRLLFLINWISYLMLPGLTVAALACFVIARILEGSPVAVRSIGSSAGRPPSRSPR